MSIEVQPKDSTYIIKPTQEDIEQARLSNDEIHLLELSGEGYELELIVKPLQGFAHRKFIQDIDKKGGINTAIKTAMASCTVFPQGDEFKALVKKFPNIPASAMGYIQEISGAARDVRGKRL